MVFAMIKDLGKLLLKKGESCTCKNIRQGAGGGGGGGGRGRKGELNILN